jgi:hypothetical protein
MGTYDHADQHIEIPTDVEHRALSFLPAPLELSAHELALAENYENGDLSGGYIESQVAFFRRGPCDESHRVRKQTLCDLAQLLPPLGLTLPSAFVELMMADNLVARLRHNTVRLSLGVELLLAPAEFADCGLLLIAQESQGLGFWYLWLAPDDKHCVVFCSNEYTPDAAVELFKCANSFAEWLFVYCRDCETSDRSFEHWLTAATS